ncbi:DUF421 domain-containing protein [Ruminococcaceae bacterium OttesenSCG-928-L11]|nr:DUF421 domain-containing protein [Ruminococcaceae bacterium OttesenSCG-928-L11]
MRTIVIYIIAVIALRIMGKRQLGELQPSELVVTILVSNLATMSIEDTNIPLLGTVMPIFTIVSCEVLVSFLNMKSHRAQSIISGNPRVIIKDGVINQQEMRNLRWTIEDLMEQLRICGSFNFTEVSFAVVETSGALSVYQKYLHRPLTPESMQEINGEDSPPVTIISDGILVLDSLQYCNVDESWVRDILARRQLDLKDVYVMICDRAKTYTIVKKERNRK